MQSHFQVGPSAQARVQTQDRAIVRLHYLHTGNTKRAQREQASKAQHEHRASAQASPPTRSGVQNRIMARLTNAVHSCGNSHCACSGHGHD